MALIHCSGGGHSIPEMVYTAVMSKSVMRPSLVIATIARPRRADAAASAVFYQRFKYWAEHNYQGLDMVILLDNQQVNIVRSLEELDRLGALATMAPLGASKIDGQLHHTETLDLLAKRGRLVGVWAKKLPLPMAGFSRLKLFVSWKKLYDKVIHLCLSGLRNLMTDPDSSLTGIPEAPGTRNVFAIVGNISSQAFEAVRDSWESHGLCLYVPTPYMKHIYVIRLANIDEEMLLQEMGLNGHPVLSQGIQDNQDLEWAMEEIAGRVKMRPNDLENLWNRR